MRPGKSAACHTPVGAVQYFYAPKFVADLSLAAVLLTATPAVLSERCTPAGYKLSFMQLTLHDLLCVERCQQLPVAVSFGCSFSSLQLVRRVKQMSSW